MAGLSHPAVREVFKIKVAVGSSDGVMIDQHFSRAERFIIYEVDAEGSVLQTGSREISEAGALNGHQPARLTVLAEKLSDCVYVLVSRIGPGAAGVLQQYGITALAVEAPVEQALARLVRFIQANPRTLLQ